MPNSDMVGESRDPASAPVDSGQSGTGGRSGDVSTDEPSRSVPSHEGFDVVARLLMAGVATVVWAAATFGAVTGNIAFLLRNKGFSMGVALCLAALGAAIAAAVVMWPTRVDRSWVIRASAFLGLLAIWW
jgi:hypothetical protein